MPSNRNPQLERAFVGWLRAQDAAIRGAITFDPTDQAGAFALKHGAIELKGSIAERGIDIYVERDGECWDELLSLIVVPAPVEGGVHCLACIPCFRRVFPDIEALWRNHLFGPLLGWMRRGFLRADRLGIYSAPGATWARLLRLGDDPCNADDIVYAYSD